MKTSLALCLLAAACLSLPAVAHETKTKDAAAAQPSAADAAMMQKWMEASTPGAQHAALKDMAGTFDTKVTSWMTAASPAETSTGTSENEVIFGGRWLEQRFSGTFMGQPFQGIGYVGYDNVKKKYVTSWIDSMGTAMMTSTGTGDAANRVMTFTGECSDPMTGKSSPMRSVLTISGPNKHVLEMYANDHETGKEFKTMELTYTRAGSAQND